MKNRKIKYLHFLQLVDFEKHVNFRKTITYSYVCSLLVFTKRNSNSNKLQVGSIKFLKNIKARKWGRKILSFSKNKCTAFVEDK